MKKSFKIYIIIFVIIILLVGIDIGSILLRKKPVFAVESKKEYKKYIGLFYNTYNCPEYSMLQIKPKWESYSCSFNIKTNENDGGWYNGN